MSEGGYDRILLGKLDEKFSTFSGRLDQYLRSPDAAAIHAARTSFRRLQACYSVIPENLHSQESRDMMCRAKEFFRANSLIRDCDVIGARLQECPADACALLIAELLQERHQQLEISLRMAREMLPMVPPRIQVPDTVNLREALALRARRRGGRFSACLPRVLANQASSEEVHGMRKDAKKLLYLMELEECLGSMRLAISLRLFQRLAGEIHDCDITIARLQAATDIPAAVLLERTLSRSGLYQQLRGLLQDDVWDELAVIAPPWTPLPATPS